MSEHLLQPATVHSLEIHGARHTRRSFLHPIFQPLVNESHTTDTTLGDVLERLREAMSKLERFGALPLDESWSSSSFRSLSSLSSFVSSR